MISLLGRECTTPDWSSAYRRSRRAGARERDDQRALRPDDHATEPRRSRAPFQRRHYRGRKRDRDGMGLGRIKTDRACQLNSGRIGLAQLPARQTRSISPAQASLRMTSAWAAVELRGGTAGKCLTNPRPEQFSAGRGVSLVRPGGNAVRPSAEIRGLPAVSLFVDFAQIKGLVCYWTAARRWTGTGIATSNRGV